ncbi:hypothetical protein MAP00_002379 [Monascus purpureus]|nr:hypothetical protein MAP00_002379 [Monascus purpureus]
MAVRVIQGKNIDEMLQRFREVQHPNILSLRGCFVDGGLLFTLHDDISVSLEHIVACEAYLDEVEFAAILAQEKLKSVGRILIRLNQLLTGLVACLEDCVPLQEAHNPQYCKPLGVITMELMQKYEKEGNKTGVDDIE